MPKSSGAKRKAKNAGVGIDFKKAKHRVGKKLPRARNDTDTNFKSRAISLPDQNVGQDKGDAVSRRNLTLKDLLGQCGHYSPKVRLEALQGLQELFSQHPGELRGQAGPTIEKLANRIADPEKPVRDALKSLFQETLLSEFNSKLLAPFASLLMAHICSAMTHLQAGIRTDGMQFLEIMIEAAPDIISSEYMLPALQHYSTLLAPATRGHSFSSNSLSSLLKTLHSLESFLSKAARSQKTAQQPAEEDAPSVVQSVLFTHRCDTVPLSAISQAAKALTQVADQAAAQEASSPGVIHSELMTSLIGSWAECQPSIIEAANLAEGAQAMESCLQCMHLLLQQEDYRSNQVLLASARQAILAKISPGLPVQAASHRVSLVVQQSLMRLNVAGMQLLSSFLENRWQVTEKDHVWLEKLLDFYASVLEHGEVMPARNDITGTTQQPRIPAEVYTVILAGVEKVLLLVSPERRQSLLGAVTSLLQRLSSKSPTKLAALHFIEALFASPATYMQNGADPAVSEQDACFWIQELPKLLWELGGSRLEASRTALTILMDAARFAQPGSPVAQQLTSIQPALALFYCTEMPSSSKASLSPAASAKESAVNGKAQGKSKLSRQAAISQLAKLPEQSQILAVDLMHYLPSIGEAMLTAALLLCSSSGSDHIITSRLVRVICRRCEERPEERQIIFQWLTSLLSQPTVGFQTAADAEWVGTAAVGLVRVAGSDKVLIAYLQKTVVEWMQPASSNATLCTALLTIAAAIQLTPQNTSLPSTRAQPGSVQSGCEDSHFWEQSSVRDLLPSALARAIVSQESLEEASGEAEQDTQKVLLARVHGLLQPDTAMVSMLLQAIPEEVKIARKRVSDETSGNLLGPEYVLRAAQALLYLLEDETVRPLLASAHQQLHLAAQSLRQMAESFRHDSAHAQQCRILCNQLQGLTSTYTV